MDFDYMISVIEAHKKGEVIEVLVDDNWVTDEEPSFDFAQNVYRLKPKLKYEEIKNAQGTFISHKALSDLIDLVSTKFTPDGNMTGDDWFLFDCIKQHVGGEVGIEKIGV